MRLVSLIMAAYSALYLTGWQWVNEEVEWVTFNSF